MNNAFSQSSTSPLSVLYVLLFIPSIGEINRISFECIQNSILGPWDLFRCFKVCSGAKERVGCRKPREATVPLQSLVKLQPWFLSLQWKTWLRQNCSLDSRTCSEGPALGQNMHDDDDDDVFKNVNEFLPINDLY